VIGVADYKDLMEKIPNEKEGGFIVTLFKDRFSEEELQQLGLNERQIKAVLYAKEKGKITNGEYQKINNCSRATANRDLTELAQKDVLLRNDIAGAGANYQLKVIAS
jgi:ATP-dependent DNA helicase RecG